MKRRKHARRHARRRARRHSRRRAHPTVIRAGGFSITRTKKGLRISLSLTRDTIKSASAKRKGGYTGKVLITA